MCSRVWVGMRVYVYYCIGGKRCVSKRTCVMLHVCACVCTCIAWSVWSGVESQGLACVSIYIFIHKCAYMFVNVYMSVHVMRVFVY